MMSINMLEPRHLDSLVALMVAETTPLQKLPDEMDTAFVKRIVCAYLNAHRQMNAALYDQEQKEKELYQGYGGSGDGQRL